MARSSTRKTQGTAAVPSRKRRADDSTEADVFDIPVTPEKPQKAVGRAKPAPKKAVAQRQTKKIVASSQGREKSTAPRRSNRNGAASEARQSMSAQNSRSRAGDEEVPTAAMPPRRSRRGKATDARDDTAEGTSSHGRDVPETGTRKDETPDANSQNRDSADAEFRVQSEESDEEIEKVPFDLDRNNLWYTVVEHANSLAADEDFRGEMFRDIQQSMQQLRDAATTSATAEELKSKLVANGDPVSNICKRLQDRSERDKRKNAIEFSEGGLRALICTITTLIAARRTPLQDPEHLLIPELVVEITRDIVQYSDFIRAKGIFTLDATRAIGAMRPFLKELNGELSMRYRQKRREEWEAEYQRSHQNLQEREQRQMSRFQRLNAGELHDSPRAVSYSTPEVSLPIHPAAPGTASDIQWTLEMDEALVQNLHAFRSLPLPERYLKCLTSRQLQDLSEERIRNRALTCQPSLKAWYEEKGQRIPAWVTSIQ